MEVIDKKFLTMGEVMAYLGSSRGFVYNLINAGTLPQYKVGRRTYFKLSDIEKMFSKK